MKAPCCSYWFLHTWIFWLWIFGLFLEYVLLIDWIEVECWLIFYILIFLWRTRQEGLFVSDFTATWWSRESLLWIHMQPRTFLWLKGTLVLEVTWQKIPRTIMGLYGFSLLNIPQMMCNLSRRTPKGSLRGKTSLLRALTFHRHRVWHSWQRISIWMKSLILIWNILGWHFLVSLMSHL